MFSLKPALQAILIADDATMRDNILTGRKQITIREGHRDYRAGPAMVCDHVNPWVVQVSVVDVSHRTLAEVTPEEWEADGFVSQDDLLHGLHTYYPNVTLQSPITVIRWVGVSGALVDAR